MNELFPLVAGCVLGIMVAQVSSARLRVALLVILSLIAGAAATIVSGEWETSWGFLVIDVGGVLLAAVGTSMLLARWQRRPSKSP